MSRPITWQNIGQPAPSFDNTGFGVAGDAFGGVSKGARLLAEAFYKRQAEQDVEAQYAATNAALKQGLAKGVYTPQDYAQLGADVDVSSLDAAMQTQGIFKQNILTGQSQVRQNDSGAALNTAQALDIPEAAKARLIETQNDSNRTTAYVGAQGAAQAESVSARNLSTFALSEGQRKSLEAEQKSIKFGNVDQLVYGQGPNSFYAEGLKDFEKNKGNIIAPYAPLPISLMTPETYQEFESSIPPSVIETARDNHAKSYAARKTESPEVAAELAFRNNVTIAEIMGNTEFGRSKGVDDAAYSAAAHVHLAQKQEDFKIAQESQKAWELEGDASGLIYDGNKGVWGRKSKISPTDAKSIAYQKLHAPENDDVIAHAQTLFQNKVSFENAMKQVLVPGESFFGKPNAKYVDNPMTVLKNLHDSVMSQAVQTIPSDFDLGTGDPVKDSGNYIGAQLSGRTASDETSEIVPIDFTDPVAAKAAIVAKKANDNITAKTITEELQAALTNLKTGPELKYHQGGRLGFFDAGGRVDTLQAELDKLIGKETYSKRDQEVLSRLDAEINTILEAAFAERQKASE